MKKLVIVAAILAFVSAVAIAANSVVSLPTDGNWKYGTGVAKISYLRVTAAIPAAVTVTVSRVSSDLATTQSLYSAVCSSGAATADLSSSNVWFIAGDYVRRSGGATNGACILIMDGEQ
jgi:hypothetical protein